MEESGWEGRMEEYRGGAGDRQGGGGGIRLIGKKVPVWNRNVCRLPARHP